MDQLIEVMYIAIVGGSSVTLMTVAFVHLYEFIIDLFDKPVSGYHLVMFDYHQLTSSEKCVYNKWLRLRGLKHE